MMTCMLKVLLGTIDAFVLKSASLP